MKVPSMDIIETIRALGEMKSSIKEEDSGFIQWVMRIGECRNILNNALIEFYEIQKVIKEVEFNIPQFHKQPGGFKKMQEHIDQLTAVIREVNYFLSYVQEEKDYDDNVCPKCGEEGEDIDDDE